MRFDLKSNIQKKKEKNMFERCNFFVPFLVDCLNICLIWFFFCCFVNLKVYVIKILLVFISDALQIIIQYLYIVNLVKYFLIFFFSFIIQLLNQKNTRLFSPLFHFTNKQNEKKKVVSVNAKSYVKELILPRA